MKVGQISNLETTSYHDVEPKLVDARVVDQNKTIVLTTVLSAMFDVLQLSKNATSYHGDVIAK